MFRMVDCNIAWGIINPDGELNLMSIRRDVGSCCCAIFGNDDTTINDYLDKGYRVKRLLITTEDGMPLKYV